MSVDNVFYDTNFEPLLVESRSGVWFHISSPIRLHAVPMCQILHACVQELVPLISIDWIATPITGSN